MQERVGKDGRVFRLSGLDWTARTRNIQVDPRVSLTIVDPGGYLSVTVAGRASIVGGPAALDETRPILEKATRAEAEIAARWAELNAGGDRVAIIVVPERMVWQETAPGLRADRPARWMGQIESEDSRVDGRAPRSGTASDERSG